MAEPRRRGRPCRAEAPASKSIRFSLTELEYAKVERLVAKHGDSIADTIRLALIEIADQAGDERPVFVGPKNRDVADPHSSTAQSRARN